MEQQKQEIINDLIEASNFFDTFKNQLSDDECQFYYNKTIGEDPSYLQASWCRDSIKCSRCQKWVDYGTKKQLLKHIKSSKCLNEFVRNEMNEYRINHNPYLFNTEGKIKLITVSDVQEFTNEKVSNYMRYKYL